MKTVKTLKDMSLYDKESYQIMMNFCDTIDCLGLAPFGLSTLEFRHVAPKHFASACFKFYTEQDALWWDKPFIYNNE